MPIRCQATGLENTLNTSAEKAHSQERPVDDRSSYRREVLEERGEEGASENGREEETKEEINEATTNE